MGDSKKAAKEPLEEVLDIGSSDQEATAETVEAESAEADQDPVDELEAKLEEAQAKAEENWDKLLRSQAELDNLRRRSERDLGNAHKYALERFAQDLLPVIDGMEMGVSVASEEGVEVAKLKEGAEITLKMALDLLEKHGISQVDPTGERFDPDFHQAMSTQPDDKVDPNTVLMVYQKGYLLNERLIRPAMVVVSKRDGDDGDEKPKIDERA